MNFPQLQAGVLNRLNMSASDPAASQAGDLVNEGLHMVEVAHPGGWPYLRKTITYAWVAGIDSNTFATIAPSDTIMRVNDLRVASGTTWLPIDYINPEEADQLYRSTDDTAIPALWYAEGRVVTLRPAPSAALSVQLRVIVGEPDLIDTASPIMPEAYHPAIVAGAIVVYYETLQDVARAEAASRRFDGWIARMMPHAREVQSPPRIQVR